jgi:choline dehydrogenase-like flavoprotein
MTAAAGPAARQPLSASWREWIASPPWQDKQWTGTPFDAIVVGSGYGGSASALRLAQKGWRVLLLERGSEYLPGEFASDFSSLPKFFRVNVPGQGAPMGRATGLVEVHLGQGMVAVTANGLGGGSLVNAGVVMQPDPDVFAQPQWPAAIRHAGVPALQPFYDRARAQLRIARWDPGLPGGGGLAKTAALQRLASRLGTSAAPVDATIDPGRCLRCGDCASGCNVPEAKGSLPETYLRAALATGRVQIVTQAEVYRFAPEPGGGWRVHVFSTDAQQQFVATREVFSDPRASATTRGLVAPLLFVCAGTLGSTQLLQRSQALASDRLAFSPALGSRVSGNGDSLSWLVDEPDCVASLGRGQQGLAAWAQAQRGEPYDRHGIVGPTITAAIDLRQPAAGRLPLEERLLLEDGAVPRAIAQVYRELLATAGTLKALDGWWFPRPPRHAAGEDPLAASEHRAQHAQVLLVMGHDGSPARLAWLEGEDRSVPFLPAPEQLRTYQAQQRLFARIGRRHVPNPLWQAMPAAALELMSGPRPSPVVSTVHPLGGCVMGDDPDCGVVDDRGQVWVREPGRGLLPPSAMELPAGRAGDASHRNEPRLYKGLYVLDGAIVPTALGCNPLWTIAALAERALDGLPAAPGQAMTAPLRGALRNPCAAPSPEVRIDARLHELLLAGGLPARGAFARRFGARTVAARLQARFDSEDIQADLRTQGHALQAQAVLALGADRADAGVEVENRGRTGCFQALPASAGSSGPGLFLRSALEFLLLLAACGAVPVALLWGWHWRAAALALVAAVLLLVLLPFGRTLLTWCVLRAARDWPQRPLRGAGVARTLAWALALFRQLVHASEKRVMRYRLPMQLQGAVAGLPQHVTLHARKTVMYRASPGEALRWLLGRVQGRRVALRPTFWEQVMNADVRVRAGRGWPGQRVLLRGRMGMGFDNLTSSGLSSARLQARGAMELGPRGDTTSGLLALAGYPLLFLRFALKTRLLDFRLPDYSNLPLPDQAPEEETRLRLVDGGFAAAELHWLAVERGRSSNDRGDEALAPLQLQLRRYRARDAAGAVVPTPIEEGLWMGLPVARAKSVLLLHAFGQSGLSFTFKTTQENLAEHFLRAGHEVWVLEMRMSTRSGYAGEPCSVDQIARHDIPAAVRHILEQLRQESGQQLPLQIAAFAQCMGAAALWMALLSGALSHRRPAALRVRATVPQLSMLSHAMSSQVHPWLVGARGTQAKTWLPALLQALWRHGAIPFAVRGPQQGVFLPLLDRLLASLPAPAAEDRSVGGHEDASATCRRIRFIEAPLFRHENVNSDTFAAMNLLFGEANLHLFTQARRFVDRERLVDEDGVNRYLTDDNLRLHLAFPLQLLHGEANELFDARSARRSFEALGNYHEGWQRAFCRRGDGQVGPVLVPGHGHIDVLIGERAPQLVYPQILHFFAQAFATREHAAGQRPPAGWAARPPRVGPFVGWLRSAPGGALLRVSFVVDDGGGLPQGSELPPIRLRLRPRGGSDFVTLPGQQPRWHVLRVGTDGDGDGDAAVAQRLAWADLALEGAAASAQEWQVLTLHEAWGDRRHRRLLEAPDAPDAQLDAHLRDFEADRMAPRVAPRLSEGDRFAYDSATFRLPAIALASLAGDSERVPFAIGCCRHPGLGPDQPRVDLAVERFLQGHARDPAAFALLLGDQIYADATAGLVDPASALERYYERHETAFRRQGLGRLLAALPVYMTQDDHEWTDGYPVGGPLVREPWPDWAPQSGYAQRQQRAANVAAQAVTAFQRLQSPLGARTRPRYRFAHGCVRCYVLDTRGGRQRDAPVIVSEAVLASLRRWLLRPQAQHSLNVIASGSVVLPGMRMNADPANPGCIDTWQYAPRQRQALLEMLVQLVPGRFLLLAGDYHVSGAAHVQQGGRTVGAAVLAPPLYAPMPYANASPESVFTDETVALAGAGVLRLDWPAGGELAAGSGLGRLEVRRRGAGFAIGLRRDLWVWETGQEARLATTLVL